MRVVQSIILLLLVSCSKKNATVSNHAPVVTLAAETISVSPFMVKFTAVGTDVDADALQYNWDFGEGTKKSGSNIETMSFPQGATYVVKVTASDGNASSVPATITINTAVTKLTVDLNQRYQTMKGFGGFGAKDVYWSGGPFTSASFVDDLINDLGVTILRDNIPTDFESVNDDADPNSTSLANFQLGSLASRLQYLKDMKAAGLNTFIVSIWSAPPWMKTNGRIDNGTSTNAAPPYNPNPTSADNQLRTDMYEEFAERCVAYIRIIKQETGLDVFAMSLQNEPRFSQFYESTVFDGAALANLIKVVGKRFETEGLATKIFMPEDVGYFEGINGLIQPILADAEAMKYVDIIATHGYAFDGVTAGSADAQTWQTMFNWGASRDLPLWMTETSGFANDMQGAVDLSKAMYTAMKYGKVSAWLFWTFSGAQIDPYYLMNTAGQKSKRYFSSKNFYRYVRPGAQRIDISDDAAHKLFALAFINDATHEQTIIIINDQESDRAIQVTGTGLQSAAIVYRTSENEDALDKGTANIGEGLIVPAKSVVTLFSKN